jgi:COP9 signalosome complex subunit 2
MKQKRSSEVSITVAQGTAAGLICHFRTDNKATILDDPFIRYYIDDVLRSLRTQYMIDLIKPYTRIELKFLAKVSYSRRFDSLWCADRREQQLNVSTAEVEDLLVCLILDGKIKGRVDQVNGRVELDKL